MQEVKVDYMEEEVVSFQPFDGELCEVVDAFIQQAVSLALLKRKIEKLTEGQHKKILYLVLRLVGQEVLTSVLMIVYCYADLEELDSNMDNPIMEEIRLRVFGYNVSRNVYSEEEFQRLHVRSPLPPSNIWEKLMSNCWCSKGRCKRFLSAVFPFVAWIPKYKVNEALLGDFLAGVNAGLTFVPQGKNANGSFL
ncbi:hypothetical protein NDU88_005336 [Pleurodeles waltl]|uniref:Uncharacterized protein n=1 Tax=Pleurodeles waltl TaxID=8319 RepID=A0AAV7QEF9_PLEWA|nr:hypothetical protein NDU88_005336 [Pleurodeles waltl]